MYIWAAIKEEIRKKNTKIKTSKLFIKSFNARLLDADIYPLKGYETAMLNIYKLPLHIGHKI